MSETKTGMQRFEAAQDRLAGIAAVNLERFAEQCQAWAERPERAEPVSESVGAIVDTDLDNPAYGGGWGLSGAYYTTNRDDRTGGRYRPHYENAEDLRRMRAASRKLLAGNGVAVGAMEALTNYTIGEGVQLQASPAGDGAESLAAQVQSALDEFVAANNLSGGLDRAIHADSRIDGQSFAVLYPESQTPRCEVLSTDYVCEPASPSVPQRKSGYAGKAVWWHGVHAGYSEHLRRYDIERPLGYHACYDSAGDAWDYLPASRVVQFKRNVGDDAPAGVPDLVQNRRDFENIEKIRHNTAEGAAILAALVLIRKHAAGTSQSSIQSMVNAAANATTTERTRSGGTSTLNIERTRPGTVKDTPQGMEYQLGPLGTLRSPVYIEVAQFLMRVAGARWNMPEFLISGDASNANYASTLVSEGPFVKAREQDQRWYGRRLELLAWKALRLMHAAGRFGGVTWEQLQRHVTLSAKFPEVASRDAMQAAQVSEILHRNGVKSKRTWATDAGLDYDEERGEMESEPAAQPLAPQFEKERVDAIRFSLIEGNG